MQLGAVLLIVWHSLAAVVPIVMADLVGVFTKLSELVELVRPRISGAQAASAHLHASPTCAARLRQHSACSRWAGILRGIHGTR